MLFVCRMLTIPLQLKVYVQFWYNVSNIVENEQFKFWLYIETGAEQKAQLPKIIRKYRSGSPLLRWQSRWGRFRRNAFWHLHPSAVNGVVALIDQLRNGDNFVTLSLQSLQDCRQSGGRILRAVVKQNDRARLHPRKSTLSICSGAGFFQSKLSL